MQRRWLCKRVKNYLAENHGILICPESASLRVCPDILEGIDDDGDQKIDQPEIQNNHSHDEI